MKVAAFASSALMIFSSTAMMIAVPSPNIMTKLIPTMAIISMHLPLVYAQQQQQRRRERYDAREGGYAREQVYQESYSSSSSSPSSSSSSRQKKRKQRQSYSSSNTYNHNSNDNINDDHIDDEEMKENFKKIYDVYKSISPTQQSPRHIIHGFMKGLTCILFGLGSGLPFLFGLPYVFIKSADGFNPWVGGIFGIIAGGLTFSVTSLVGISTGLYQIVIGLLNTPQALSSYLLKTKVWNMNTNQWESYSLDDEAAELNSATFNTEVTDSTFYDILGVKPGAKEKEIKKAYYTKAKDLHPDKNPDDEEAATRFIKIHEAYETLSDPDKRKQYDSVGKPPSSSSSSSSGTGFEDFNVGVFFEILFASQPVEPYVGRLAVSSFFGQFMNIIQATTNNDNLTLDAFMKVLQSSQSQKLQRPVNVALHLRDFSQEYVKGNISENVYREMCKEEANKIAENFFGETFLLHIGKALVQEANLFLSQSWYGLPLWVYSATAKKWRRIYGNVGTFHQVSKIIRSMFSGKYAATGEEGNEYSKRPPKNRKDTKKKSQYRKKNATMKKDGEEEVNRFNVDFSEEMFEDLLPLIVEIAWAFNGRDIANVLEQACEKLFFDTKSHAAGESRRRARALRILGQTFISRGSDKLNPSHCADTEESKTCRSPDAIAQEMKVRAEVAFRVAQQGLKQSNEENEDMIRIAKKANYR